MDNWNLLQRSLNAVWHPCSQMKSFETTPLIPIKRGEGVWLVDYDGKRYLDAVSSWWVNLFGHNNLKIKTAIRNQLDELEHVILAGFTHAPVIELSEQLTNLTHLGHSFYASDGASATEIALKMSFHYWQNVNRVKKDRFICLKNSYHGETIGALSVTDLAIFKDAYAPLLRQTHQLTSPDWRLAEVGEGARDYAVRCAVVLEEYLSIHHDSIAAFILEPLVQCAGGMGMYHPIYLTRVREICDRFQIHLILDEIAVGFGRTGTMFAFEQANMLPDFLCLSKGITGGYLPLSVVQTTNDIYEAFYDDKVSRAFLHSHSYTGNPLACSAALATLNIFKEEEILNRNQDKQAYINKALSELEVVKMKGLRNTGMIWAFDVDSENKDFARHIYLAALDRGLLLRPIGNTVYWMPPYVIEPEEMDFMIKTTIQLVTECA